MPSCSAVAFALADAFAFTTVPSPATTSTRSSPSLAAMISVCTSSCLTAPAWRVTNRAMVA